MRLAYPVEIKRNPEDPAEATVHFPDFGTDGDDVIAWGDKASMLEAAAFSLGTAYATATVFGGEPPVPSKVKEAASKTRLVCMATCNYDLFREHCLNVREVEL